MDQSSPAKPIKTAASPRTGKVGVLLVNLGTPDGTEPAPMRRYLREFLSDRRVIEWPRAVWYPILYGIVLNTRPKKSGALYKTIWNEERNESPLLTFTRAQSEKLAEALKGHETVIVDYAMRYGNPSMESVTKRLMSEGCDRIVMFPLYPQYSAATTASVNDKFFEALMKMRFQPAIRIVPTYHDDPVYIDALARSIETHLATLDFEPETVIASYHGIPQSYARRGDPYPQQCHETSRLLRERLGWDDKKLIDCFQSRFGPEEWLQPYADKTIEKLAKEGMKSIAVFNPGFVSDCLETLEEIAVQGQEIFHHAGGKNFSHIPCLNDSAEGMAVIETLVKRELAGWV
ncbi:MAG: ferrochelatase [Hyphomicrobiales bacterium]|nr:ferrochelatase [Hyphomicrobiales bacterium]